MWRGSQGKTSTWRGPGHEGPGAAVRTGTAVGVTRPPNRADPRPRLRGDENMRSWGTGTPHGRFRRKIEHGSPLNADLAFASSAVLNSTRPSTDLLLLIAAKEPHRF